MSQAFESILKALMGYGVCDRGTAVTRPCEKCNVEFQTRDGVVTIKGPSPPKSLCIPCEEARFNELVGRMTRF